LLVGSGKVSELSAKNLIDNGADSITLLNRTPERAAELASRWGGQTLPFEALPAALHDADIVLSSTSSPAPVIRVEHARAAMIARAGRPLLLIDLAVPRDIDPEVATVPGIHLYDIDDLAGVVSTNLLRRQAEIGAVQAIVEDEVDRFMAWLASRSVVPTLNQLRAQADQISRLEVDKALRHLSTLDEHGRAVVESLAASIVNKLLHQPTVRLKREAANGDASSYAEALQYLFGLDGVTHGT
jgi:glutamyl-tRNA reductase